MFVIEADAHHALLKVTLRDVADHDELARLLMGIETTRPHFPHGYRLWLVTAGQVRPLQDVPGRQFDVRTAERHAPPLRQVVIELAPGDRHARDVASQLADFYRALPVPVALVLDANEARDALAWSGALPAGGIA